MEPKFENKDLELDLSTNLYFPELSSSGSSFFDDMFTKGAEILVKTTNRIRTFLPINEGRVLDTYLPADYVFTPESVLFKKLLNFYLNNTMYKRVYWITPEDNTLHVEIHASNLPYFNDAKYMGLTVFLLYLTLKFDYIHKLCHPSDATIFVNAEGHNLEGIDEVIDIWRMIFASFQFTRFSVFCKSSNDDSKPSLHKIAEFDLAKSV